MQSKVIIVLMTILSFASIGDAQQHTQFSGVRLGVNLDEFLSYYSKKTGNDWSPENMAKICKDNRYHAKDFPSGDDCFTFEQAVKSQNGTEDSASFKGTVDGLDVTFTIESGKLGNLSFEVPGSEHYDKQVGYISAKYGTPTVKKIAEQNGYGATCVYRMTTWHVADGGQINAQECKCAWNSRDAVFIYFSSPESERREKAREKKKDVNPY